MPGLAPPGLGHPAGLVVSAAAVVVPSGVRGAAPAVPGTPGAVAGGVPAGGGRTQLVLWKTLTAQSPPPTLSRAPSRVGSPGRQLPRRGTHSPHILRVPIVCGINQYSVIISFREANTMSD